ncbi:MAG: DUF938 domain-containing protein [Alphaproteobacteria bacterium]|nr:DUF938 domain-containing protein [Alphaproteobacteria bacterium]
MSEPEGAARHAPATLRNRASILAVLERILPRPASVIEIASGTGEHAAYFAGELGPEVTWWPSDCDEEALASIAAHGRGQANLRLPALHLDMTQPGPVPAPCRPDAIVCINMIHIAPWSATLGLMRLAGAWLQAGGQLYLYGPFRVEGTPLAPSNDAFDRSLKARDPAWGLRLLGEVAKAAGDQRLDLAETIDMPANNLSVIFRKRAGQSPPC